MVSFTRIFFPVCCNRQQINQNAAKSSQRSKHHSILHRCHVGFRDRSTSGLSGIQFLSCCSEILFKVNWLVLSNFKASSKYLAITLFHNILLTRTRELKDWMFAIVWCTADRNLIAYRSTWRRAWVQLLRSHFHPSLKSDAIAPGSLHSSLNEDSVFCKLDILQLLGS